MWAGFAAYLAFVALAPALGRRVVWATIVLLVAAFAAAPVLLSHDVFSYLDYARLGVVHGIDPYLRGPAAAPSDPVFARVTWPHTTSAYGPLFTLATYPLAWLPVGLAVAVLKAVAAISILGLAAVVARLAAWRGVEPLRAAAFVALNPLVLVHVVGGAHNDGLTMLVAMLGVAAVLAGREASGGAALVGAIAIKVSAAAIAPFALLGSRSAPAVPYRSTATKKNSRGARDTAADRVPRPTDRLIAGATATAIAVLFAADLTFGWNWLHALGIAGENQGHTSHLSIPTTLGRISGLGPGPVRVAAAILYAALVAYLLVRTWRGRDWIDAAGWAALGLLLATAWLLPWYLIWALPLAAISRDRPLQLLTLALTAFQLGARIPL